MEGSQNDQHTFKLSPKLYEEAGRHNLSTLRGPSDKLRQMNYNNQDVMK